MTAAISNSKTYGASDPPFTATQTGFTAVDLASVTLTATRAPGEGATTYAITPAAAGTAISNYTITYVPGTFTINGQAATVTATNNSKTYGASDPPLAAIQTGFTAADALTIALGATRAPGEVATNYVMTPFASGAATANYTISYVPGVFTIIKQPLIVTAGGFRRRPAGNTAIYRRR